MTIVTRSHQSINSNYKLFIVLYGKHFSDGEKVGESPGPGTSY